MKRTNLKFILLFILTLFAVMLFGTTKVEALTGEEYDQWTIEQQTGKITVDLTKGEDLKQKLKNFVEALPPIPEISNEDIKYWYVLGDQRWTNKQYSM